MPGLNPFGPSGDALFLAGATGVTPVVPPVTPPVTPTGTTPAGVGVSVRKVFNGLPNGTVLAEYQLYNLSDGLVVDWTAINVLPLASQSFAGNVPLPVGFTDGFIIVRPFGNLDPALVSFPEEISAPVIPIVIISPTQPGAGPVRALAQHGLLPVTYEGIVRHLTGLDHWLENAARSRSKFDREAILKTVPAMVRSFEAQSNFYVTQRQITTLDDGAYRDPATGLSFDPAWPGTPTVHEPGYTYYRSDADEYFRLILKRRPVLAVQRLRLTYGQEVLFSFPHQWISLDNQSGQIEIIPAYGSASFGAFSAAFRYLGASVGSSGYLPNAIQVDYVCGLPAPVLDPVSGAYYGGWADDPEWAHLLDAMEKYCALRVLESIAQLPDAGMDTVSVAGETRNYTRFEKRKAELQAGWDRFVKEFVDDNVPVLMSFV